MITIQGQKHYTLSEAAPLMGYSLLTLRSYVKHGKIATVKVAGRHYISEDKIKEHLGGTP